MGVRFRHGRGKHAQPLGVGVVRRSRDLARWVRERYGVVRFLSFGAFEYQGTPQALFLAAPSNPHLCPPLIGPRHHTSFPFIFFLFYAFFPSFLAWRTNIFNLPIYLFIYYLFYLPNQYIDRK